ncbi:hypothetical protein MINT15_35170 [Saccharomonospora viridis]|uniref:Uncharacterized protein n=1 Tax=Saccharomonospora viridis TaxID=1852 RepID=A0A837D7X2_9PSEU|nr:hypothetical protein MINT15_35170 [Saccharomonospora viridis]
MMPSGWSNHTGFRSGVTVGLDPSAPCWFAELAPRLGGAFDIGS